MMALSCIKRGILEKGSRSRSDLRLRDRSRTVLWFYEWVPAKEIGCSLTDSIIDV